MKHARDSSTKRQLGPATAGDIPGHVGLLGVEQSAMLLCHRPALPLGSTARLPTARDSAAAICHKAQAGFCDPVLCDPAPDRSHGVRAVTPTFARLRTSGSKRPAPERASVCTRAEGGPSASGIEDRSFSDVCAFSVATLYLLCGAVQT